MSYHPYKVEELSRARQILVQELDLGPLRYMKRKLQSSKDSERFNNVWEGEDGLMTQICGNFPMPTKKYEEPSILESNIKKGVPTGKEKDILVLDDSSDASSDSVKVISNNTKPDPIEISEESDCEIVAFTNSDSTGCVQTNLDSGHNIPCAKSLPGKNTLKRTVSPVQMSDIAENDMILALSEQNNENPLLSQSCAVVHTQVAEGERNESMHNNKDEKVNTNSLNVNKKEKINIMGFHQQPKEKKSDANFKEMLKNIVGIRVELKKIGVTFKNKKLHKMACKRMANICCRIEGFEQGLKNVKPTKAWHNAMTQLKNIQHQFQMLYKNRLDIISGYNISCLKNMDIVKIPEVSTLKKLKAVGVIPPNIT